jgi:hypothetical protein
VADITRDALSVDRDQRGKRAILAYDLIAV